MSGTTLLTALAAPVIGAVLGASAMAGLVWQQTQAPEQNPASQEILPYGDSQ